MASEFNKTIKAFLRHLAEAVGEDHSQVRRMRKLYMRHKRQDPESPMKHLRELMGRHSEAILQRDLDKLLAIDAQEELAGIDLSFVRGMTEEHKERAWTFVGSIHVMAGTLGSFDPTVVKNIQSLAEDCAKQISDPRGRSQKDVMAEMMSVTARAMPALMKNMGVDVSEEDVQAAQEKIMSGQGPLGDLGSLIGGMVDAAGAGEPEEHQVIGDILG
jgi:hypothetical protein